MNFREEDSAQEPLEARRAYAFLLLLGGILIIFIFRLFSFQIIQNTQWIDQANINRTNELSIPTQRGTIQDRNGTILASNIPSYNIAITPAFLPDDEGDLQIIFQELSSLTGTPLNLGSLNDPLIPCEDNLGINQMVEIGDSFAPFTPVLIACDIDRDIAIVIQEKAVDWPGVSVQIEPIRDFPTGELTAPIIGFLGPIPAIQEDILRALGFVAGRDKVGYAGVEYSFEDIMRGIPGSRVVEVDVAGQILRDIEPPVAPVAGLNLTLTIDTRLQLAADAILKGEIDDWNQFFGEIRITSGAAIAMNPQTGEILALISFPSSFADLLRSNSYM
ncbi:MAG: hypothetical protein IH859_03970 [Chloroflexi bacterium]|nr:hypothetical protein [Chloroflexota bacterium]